MKEVIVEVGQNIWDVGIQEYGHTDGAFLIVTDNPQYALTDTPIPGSVLLIPGVVPPLSDTNQAIVAQYQDDGTRVASGAITNLTPTPPYVRIGYWANGYVRLNG